MLEVYLATLICLAVCNVIFCVGKIANKKIFAVLDIISVVILILIMSHSSYSDLAEYERHYTFSAINMLDSRFEAGFNWYMLICKYYLNMSYYQFKLITYTICILLLYITYRKFTYNFSYFAFLFMLYEMFFGGLQIRNFIAICLIVFGLPYLMSGKVKGTIIFIITVIIAFFFHASSIAMLAFSLIGINYKSNFYVKHGKRMLEGIALAIVIVGIYLARTGRLSLIISAISLMAINTDTSNRILSHSSRYFGGSHIFLTIIILSYCFFVTYVMKKEKNIQYINLRSHISVSKMKLQIVTKQENMEYEYIRKFEYLNYISLFFLALCFIGTTFYRLIRNMCLIDIFFWGITMNNSRQRSMRVLIFMVSIVFIAGWIYYDLIVPERFIEHITGYLM